MMKRSLALIVPSLVVVVSWHLFSTTTAWVMPVHWIVSAIFVVGVAVFAVATWRGAGSPRLVLAVLLLGAELAVIVTLLAGVRLLGVDLFGDKRLAGAVGVALAVAIYGLLRRRVWGRWLGLGLGATGLMSGGINFLQLWPVTSAVNPQFPAWSMQMFESEWVLALTSLGGAIVLACLASAPVGELFAERAHGTWGSRDRLVRALRLTIIAAFVAVPMLLVYVWAQPLVSGTRTTALVLAGALTVGAFVAARGKVIGAVLLVLAGLGLFAQTAFTYANTDEHRIAAYYAVFWLPGAALSLASGAMLLAALVRKLRR